MSRWQTVPTEWTPPRRELATWPKGDAAIVKAWVERQGPEVTEKVRERAQEYFLIYTTEKMARLWHEAALDLVMWQRGGLSPAKAKQWLRDWDEAVKSKV
jgi:hypothetical protein